MDSGAENIPNSIDLSDVDGFTDLVNSLESDSEVDILLHSPGGSPDATERIVSVLRGKVNKINFLIPHSAYSARVFIKLCHLGYHLSPNFNRPSK